MTGSVNRKGLSRSVKSAEMSGRLHSYETLGTLDGPGLRLVVFLQGCPLRCRCCHNPDTWDFAGGRQVTVDEIVAKARRMKPYFGQNGGVTLSGGEPLVQAAFTLELLRALRRDGIHTALDTSGFYIGPEDTLKAILAETDLVLLDIKHPDPDHFAAWTGMSFDVLHRFLVLANSAKQQVWIRQVIVPGFNDNEANVSQLASLIRRYPQLNVEKVELLAYHTLGVAKYEALGLPDPLPGVPALSSAQLADWQRMIDQLLA